MDDLALFNEGMRFCPEVEAAIAEAFPSDDPMDSPDFDPVKLINETFPNEQSLVDLDPVLEKLSVKIRQIDREIQSAVRSQSQLESEGKQALADAQRGMEDLFTRIRDIHDKADLSEKMVKEITRDIKSLDFAKHHLTSTITSLNHLHMLVGGIDSLNTMVKARQYRDTANFLSAVTNALEHLNPYLNIERVKILAEEITKIKRTLARQIMTEFQETFRTSSVPDRSTTNIQQLAEACLVLDVLESDVKLGFLEWFLDVQLLDYRQSFDAVKHEEQAWIDKLDHRYLWFKKALAAFRESCGDIFPNNWFLPELIAQKFCEITKEDLAKIITKKPDAIDVKLLIWAFKQTANFERQLATRFKDGVQPDVKEEEEEVAGNEEPEPDPIDPASMPAAVRIRYEYAQKKKKEMEEQKKKEAAKKQAAKEKQRSQTPVHKTFPFIGYISEVFEKCMSVYIIAQDGALQSMMETFYKDFRKEVSIFLQKQNKDDDTTPTLMLPTCTDLFEFFKNSVKQCAQLSQKEPLFNLFRVFKKHLNIYCSKVLTDNCPKIQQLNQAGNKEIIIQLSSDELIVICVILNTCDYCSQKTSKLEEKLKETIDSNFKEKISLSDEQDLFSETASKCVSLLFHGLESSLLPLLSSMTKTSWDSFAEVGDSSPYVAEMSRELRRMIPIIRNSLLINQKYFIQICLKFADSFIPKIISSLFKCKNVVGFGAEQLLLDMQSLRALLLEVPCLDSADKTKPPNYTRLVTKIMAKAELIPKVLMTPHDDPRLFVEDFNMKLPNEELSTFKSILDMLSIKKSDQSAYIDLYRGIANANATPTTATTADASSTDKPTPKILEGSKNAILEGKNAIVGGAKSIKSRITGGLQKANVDRILRRFKDPPK